MKLSEIVMAYRKEHGLSIRQFAQKCGLSHSAIANVENERNSMGNPYTPSFETLQHLALGMGLSVNDLIKSMDDADIYISEVDEMRDELKDNPDLRMLLSAAYDLKPEDIRKLTEIAKTIRRD